MIRKHVKKIVILSLFFLLVSGFGIKHAVGKRKAIPALICWETVTGDIWIEPGCTEQGIMHNTTQLLFKWPDIDLAYFQGITFKVEGDGLECFSQGYYPDEGLAVVKENDGSASARVHFYAFVNDGETELHYILRMYGTFDGDWPPPDGGVTTVYLDSWEMESEGRGKLRRLSCTGPGDFQNIVTIKVTRENL